MTPSTSLLLALITLAAAPSDDAAGLLRTAQLQVAQGDTSAARQTLAALGDPPTADRYLGDLLRGADRPEQAVAAYRRALDARPDDAEAATGLGEALLDLGRPQDAEEPLERAARTGSVRALSALGRARVALEDVSGALAAWRQARELGGDDGASAAAELYEYYHDRYRRELRRMREEGWAAHAGGRYAKAAPLLLGYALALGNSHAEALAGGRAALAANLPAEMAIEGFLLVQGSESSDEQLAEALKGSGAARLRLGEVTAAAEDFERAIELAPYDAEAYYGSAIALARLNRGAEAAGRLERALQVADEQSRRAILRNARREPSLSGRGADARVRQVLSRR
jgi:tetratricopeptide (TPR) repeat protein